jgi:uncharacterized membrane-anchored protein YjiN (DUF445 family)
MSSTAPASGRAAAFRRMRLTATLLLLLMTVIFLVTSRYQSLHPALPYVRAFAEAAMVGGLADWFAIVALFRRPFGLPIPHTAIIPANKARIGKSLGDFIGGTFLTEEVLRGMLDSLALPPQAGKWLAEEANACKLADWLIAQGPVVAEAFESFGWRDRLFNLASGIPLGSLLARGVARASATGLHEPWIDAGLDRLSLFLREHQDDIRQAVTVHSSRWIPEWVDVRLADRLSDALVDLLQHLRLPDHRWRQALDRTLRSLPERLAGDPHWQEEAARLQHMLFADPALREEIAAMMSKLKDRFGLDRDSLAGFIRGAGERLATDLGWQATLQRWMVRIGERVLVPRRDAIGAFVAGMVASWDDRTIVGKLETEVGADLQFIRLNGTLVGGVVGLFLYAVSVWLS